MSSAIPLPGPTRAAPEPDPLKFTLGEIRARNTDTNMLSLQFDRIAFHNGRIMHISVIGQRGDLKRFRALMSGAGKSTTIEAQGVRAVQPSKPESSQNLYKIGHDTDGYYSEQVGLEHDKAHMILWSKAVGFLRIMSDHSIFQEIKRSSIKHPMTCPFIPEWMDWVKAELTREGFLDECYCYRCNCGVFSASSTDLTEIVKRGLQDGYITIPDPARLPDLGHQLVYQPSTGGEA